MTYNAATVSKFGFAEPDEGARIVGRTRRQFIKCAGTLGAVAASS